MIDLRLHGADMRTYARHGYFGATDGDEMDLEMAKLLHQPCVRTFVIGPAIDEYAIDPAFEQPRHRPPVDGIDQHERIRPIDPCLLRSDIGGRRLSPEMDSDIRRREPWIEPFRGEVRDLGAITGIGQRDSLGDMCCDAVAERLRNGVGDDDERVHAEKLLLMDSR
jgi:hypothetical protein